MDKKILYGIIAVLVIVIVVLVVVPRENNLGGEAFNAKAETNRGSNSNLCYCSATETLCQGKVIYLDGGTALDCSCCPAKVDLSNADNS
jgi:hypothetical protein